MKVLAFDVETVPDLSGVNYRDYQYLKSRGKKEKSEDELTRELSLNPFTLFVVSISGVYVENGSIKSAFVYFVSNKSSLPEAVYPYGEADSFSVNYEPVFAPLVEEKLPELEREILSKFWNEVSKSDRVISFNGYSFDGYILKIRSMIHGVDIPQWFLNDRNFHIDLLQFLSEGDREKKYRFEFICRKFGIPTPKDFIDGSRIAQEFFRGNYDIIALYNLKDSLALAQLYVKLRKYIERKEECFTDKQFNKLRILLKKLSELDDDVLRFALGEFFGKSSISRLIEDLDRVDRKSSEKRSRDI